MGSEKPVCEPSRCFIASTLSDPTASLQVSVKIPKFLGFNSTPFEEDKFRCASSTCQSRLFLSISDHNFTYGRAAVEAAANGEDLGLEDPDGGQVGDLIRWRWKFGETDEQGRKIPESNARVVEWSDGSRTLMVGNESFKIKADKNAAHTALWASHDGKGILECQSNLNEKYTLRPTSLSSKAHARLAAAASSKTWEKRDSTRVKSYAEAGMKDFEKEHEKRELARDAELRSKETYAEGGAMGGGSRRGMQSYEDDGMTGNLGRLREEYKKGRGRGRQVDESALLRAKRDDSVSDVSDEDDDGFIEDSDEDDNASRRRKKARTALSDDDSA